MFAAHDCDEARFFAFEKFLDDDLVAGCAELAVEHRARTGDCFIDSSRK